MAAKLVVVLALAALAHSSVVPVDHAAVRVVEPVTRTDDVTSFSYDVADPYTGDFKSQSETRVGGTVQGQYSLLDADGTRRTVDYAADDFNGFNAVVRKDAVAVAAPVVTAPVVADRTVVAPTLARTVSAPIVTAVPNVVNTGAVVAARAVATPAVYAASAPLVSRTVVSSAPLVATNKFAAPVFTGAAPLVASRNFATPVFTGASHLVDTRNFVTPSVFAGARAVAAPLVTGVSPFFATRTLATPTVFNSPTLSRTVAVPAVVSSPLVAGNFAKSAVYAASAPVVSGGFTTFTRDAPFVTGTSFVGGDTVVRPYDTFSGRLVTGGDYFRTVAGW